MNYYLRSDQYTHVARDTLVGHLHAKASPNPALSQLDRTMTAPISQWP